MREKEEIVVAIGCLCIPGFQGVGLIILKGMLIGALGGAVMGGLGGAGAMAGLKFGCSTAMKVIFSASAITSGGMMLFDLAALAYNFQNRFLDDTGIDLRLINPNDGKLISDLNQKAHANPFYNALQFAAGAATAFTGGYVKTASCFVVGTLVATIDGLRAIEEIKPGDMVYCADENTLEFGIKPVVETFIRETSHDETVKVYNFQVENHHTYYVGENSILVHNAEKYGNGHYEHNPSDNKKVLADALEDPEAVAEYQQLRLKYMEQDATIIEKVAETRDNGYSVEEISQTACDMRNEIRLKIYLDSEGNIINQAGYEAALERQNTTRSYSALIESGKTSEQIIESSKGVDMLYNIENKNGYEVYSFKNIDLKIKCIEISDRVNVYINYNGCNPLFSMLFGGFEAECELSSIRFDIGYEKDGCNNTMYGVVSRLDAKEFIMEIYFFIMENRTAINLNEYDKNVWDY